MFSPKTDGDSLMAALFDKSESNVTCRSSLHVFSLFSIVVEEVIDSISCMIHLSLSRYFF